jgi:geranylgeranyl pyrophosphate synthase
VLNDLDGWVIDGSKARPTALLALALERCDFDEREILLTGADEKTVRKIYQKADVFSRAQRLVARLRERALNCAEDAPPRLADLLRFLVEVIVS